MNCTETIFVLEDGSRLCEDGFSDNRRSYPLDDGSPLHHTETVPVTDPPSCDCHGAELPAIA
jgi:hypothetical protein